MTSERLKELYPHHWNVWSNDFGSLNVDLESDTSGIEHLDPNGRTPLHLAVTLGHLESARILLNHGANANAENAKYWTVLQEAVGTGDPEMVQLVLKYRDNQRYSKRTAGIPQLLQKLKESPDFYVEMKWEFASWVPLVSRMCPSDTYRVWKSGSSVRIDTTLLGFDNMNWQRGSRSYIFKGDTDTATVMEVDHDRREVSSEVMRILPDPPDMSFMEPSPEAVAARLTAPIVTNYIDTDKIAFERNKSGIWGWRSDKSETVNGYDCKVFSASNVELLTKTRTEHLTEQDKQRTKKTTKTPLESFLGVAEEHNKAAGATNGDVSLVSYNPCSLSPEEYLDEESSLGDRDIGRPIEQSTKTQKFKANMCLCETYPLSLQEQVIPIIDLMSTSNAHFKKLKDFITLQLPAGFPVKIEIPLFHVLNARITFGNIYGCDEPISGVANFEEDSTMCCIVDDSCFDIPPNYVVLGETHQEHLRDEDEELLQFAIQQSLMEAGTENEQITFWEAIQPPNSKIPGLGPDEDRMLQKAIADSMRNSTDPSPASEILPGPIHGDAQLRLVMEISQNEQAEAERQRQQEEADLERIIELSLTEK